MTNQTDGAGLAGGGARAQLCARASAGLVAGQSPATDSAGPLGSYCRRSGPLPGRANRSQRDGATGDPAEWVHRAPLAWVSPVDVGSSSHRSPRRASAPWTWSPRPRTWPLGESSKPTAVSWSSGFACPGPMTERSVHGFASFCRLHASEPCHFPRTNITASLIHATELRVPTTFSGRKVRGATIPVEFARRDCS